MATITPTLTITSNASSATSSPGPISTALSISATSSLTVDKLQANTLAVTTSEAILFDGDAESGGDGAGGTVGGFLYLRNATGSTRNIHIGIVADGASAVDLTASGDTARLFTLKDTEFAFMPYDYTMDLVVDADGAGTLEYFLFDR
jgi:hypothetical protein